MEARIEADSRRRAKLEVLFMGESFVFLQINGGIRMGRFARAGQPGAAAENRYHWLEEQFYPNA
jgi:hypothetical protein